MEKGNIHGVVMCAYTHMCPLWNKKKIIHIVNSLTTKKRMKHYVHENQGTCSKQVAFDIDENNCVHNVQFAGGCPGNTVGISMLVEGMKVEDVVRRLEGVRCGFKPTSCPDQLAKALQETQQA